MIGGQVGKMLGEMIGQFGQQNVAGGLANCIQQDAANVANQHVDNCGMPQFIKDEMRQFVQSWMQDNMQNVPSDCQSACNGVYDQATNDQDGSSCTRTDGDGSSSRAESDSQMRDNMVDGNCADESEGEGDGEGGAGKAAGNWLVALAGSLASVQCKFLDAAMKDMRIMDDNAAGSTQKDTSNMSDEEKQAYQQEQDKARDQFVQAQSRYQANTQMFSMIANMTATSLKSLGEGLTAIARKQ
ncbi:MAG: hypothetical protein ABW170_15135 [Candidatus Thiodiazotropha sp. L084R]